MKKGEKFVYCPSAEILTAVHVVCEKCYTPIICFNCYVYCKRQNFQDRKLADF